MRGLIWKMQEGFVAQKESISFYYLIFEALTILVSE